MRWYNQVKDNNIHFCKTKQLHHWPENWTTYSPPAVTIIQLGKSLKHESKWCYVLVHKMCTAFCSFCFFLFFSHWFSSGKLSEKENGSFTSKSRDNVKALRHCDTYSAVSLLGSRSLPGEQDELGAVLLQALHVGLQRLCGLVTASGVNWDADCAGCLFVDASCLQVQTHWYDRVQLKNTWSTIWLQHVYYTCLAVIRIKGSM